MDNKTEYGIKALKTTKVFPKIFNSREEAETFRLKRPNPERWKIVSRKVTYSKWT